MIRLSATFLAPYYARGDAFPNLLARSVYLSKYCREGETWTDTIRRVVEANVSLDPNATVWEAEDLFSAMWWMKVLPPGRGLFTGGVEGLPVASRVNCWYYTLRSPSDWGWQARRLLEGGGVGVGLGEIGGMPSVARGNATLTVLCSRSHPNEHECMPDEVVPASATMHIVEDSREGWAATLDRVVVAAYSGVSLCVNVSAVRPRGAPIRTFGGVAPGPGPLVTMLRNVWSVIRSAQGRKLSSVDCLDVVNHIGACIRSGGVRRSAIIQLGDSDDAAFRRAKHDHAALMSHRSSSNNSIVLRTAAEVAHFDWRGLVEDVAKYGEPGFLNLFYAQLSDPSVRGTNPCFRHDTLIHTRQGHFPIRELVGKTVDVWDGKQWRNVSTFQETSQNEPMLKFTMKDGSEFAVTDYHIIVTEDGRRIEAKDVKVGEKLLVSNAPLSHGSARESGAYLKGVLVGDGTGGNDHARFYVYPPKSMCMDRLKASAEEIPIGWARTNAVTEVGFCERSAQGRQFMSGLAVQGLRAWCNEYKRSLPEFIFTWDEQSKCEFIAGVMDADGTASDTKNGFMYQISSVHLEWLRSFQMLLKTIGVYGKIAMTKRGGRRSTPSGDCDCQPLYRLSISQVGAIRLAQMVRFSRLQSFANRQTKNRSVVRRNIVEKIERDGIDAKVYCLVTDDPDQIACSNGLIIGRCAEALLDDYESCNLSNFFPSRWSDTDDSRSLLRLITRYTLRQRLEPFEGDPLGDAARAKYMRIGVGLGGITAVDWSKHSMSNMYETIRDEATEYAEKLGVRAPHRVTVVKPDGTVSGMVGVPSGVHAAYAPYYIRRIRIMDTEPMAGALMDAGVPFEKCAYDPSGHTYAFEIPMHEEAIAYSGSETVSQQIARIKCVQNWYADQAVSATVSFGEDEIGELVGCLEQDGRYLKSLSMLPRKHAYVQPPFEEIDKSEYARRVEAIDMNHPLTYSDDAVQIEACEGGVCPVR